MAGWPRAVAHPGLPQIRTCRIPASGSLADGLATRLRSRTHRLEFRVGSATRCSFVYVLSDLGVSATFPSNGSISQCPLPSIGSRWGRFPDFKGTMRHSDFPTPFPPRFVSFAWQYHLTFAHSLPLARKRLAKGLGQEVEGVLQPQGYQGVQRGQPYRPVVVEYCRVGRMLDTSLDSGGVLSNKQDNVERV